MKWGKRFFSSLLAMSLLIQPTTMSAAISEAKNKSINLSSNSFSKKAAFNPASADPSAFPPASTGRVIDTLSDSLGTQHEITYGHTATDSDETNILFQFRVNQSSAQKDRYLSIEGYKEAGGSLQLLDALEYDTKNFQNNRLRADFSIDDLRGSSYLYFRIGVSKDPDAVDYHDEVLFKVYLPPSLFIRKDPVLKTDGNYILIQNESHIGTSVQNTGFQLGYSKHKNLPAGTFKIDGNKRYKHNSSRRLAGKKSFALKAAPIKVGATKDFWVYDYEEENDYKINATLLSSSAKANVWGHGDEISAENAEKVAKEFDSAIYPAVADNFGEASDIDGDGKINLLFYDIKDGYDGSGSMMSGYFNSDDLYDKEKSNKSELLYIDTYPSLGASNEEFSNAYSTIVHELQHLVNHNRNVLVEGNSEGMETWLDESLSMAAEQIYTKTVLTERIEYYNYTKTITNGHSLLYWDYDGDTLANYSLSYLFGQYLKLQIGQGDRIFKEILQDPKNNYEAIQNAVRKYIDPTMSFGTFTGHFRTAMFLKEASGLNGFKGDPVATDLEPKIYEGAMTNLRGGGAIIKKLNSSEGFYEPTDKGGNITYTILSVNGLPVNQIPVYKIKPDPITNEDEILTGTAFPNGSVTVKNHFTTLGTVTAGSDGRFSMPIPKQMGKTPLNITAVSADKKYIRTVTFFVSKKLFIKTPVVNPINDRQSELTGMAELGYYVIVEKNNEIISKGRYSSGNYSLYIKRQPAGTVLTVYAADSDGNRSESVTVTVSKTPPAKPLVYEVGDQDLFLEGAADPDCQIYIKSGSTILAKGKTDGNGDFKIKITKQKANTILTVFAEDKQGDKGTAESIKVVDRTPPKFLIMNALSAKSTSVSGKTEAGTTIYIYMGNKLLATQKSDRKGVFSCKIKPLKKGTKLIILAKDSAGNKSPLKTIIIK